MVRTDILEHETEIRQWISEKQPKAYICRQLHCKPETLESYLTKMGIVYAGNQRAVGLRASKTYKPAMYYIENNIQIKSHELKQKILKDGLKPRQCEICGNTMWNNVEIPLELHHIDGNHYNNTWNNLQLLCPNCHALTTNNAGAANKKTGK